MSPTHFLGVIQSFLGVQGLLPILSLLLILANFVLQFFPVGWLAETNLLLHIGLILTLSGLMLAWALLSCKGDPPATDPHLAWQNHPALRRDAAHRLIAHLHNKSLKVSPRPLGSETFRSTTRRRV